MRVHAFHRGHIREVLFNDSEAAGRDTRTLSRKDLLNYLPDRQRREMEQIGDEDDHQALVAPGNGR